MKLAKRFAALLMGATLAIGSVAGLAACGESGTSADNNTQSAGDEQIRAVYDLYTANCAENNVTPQTYEQWLASIKGAKGDPGEDGLTPQIDPETGHWVIGDYDTGIKAAGTNGSNGSNGSNGVTPHIGENGNWFIGEEDTHVKAEGTNGSNGQNGTNGTSFRHGHGAPTVGLGMVGDLYLNVDTWDVYERTAEGWSSEPIGNIKGTDGKDASSQPSDGSTKTWNNVTISKDEPYTLDLSGVEKGLYWLIADTETEAACNILKVQRGSFIGYDMCTARSDGYKAVIDVGGEGDTVLSTTSDTAINANLKLIKYEPITLTAGVEIEVPVCSDSLGSLTVSDGQPLFPLKMDSSLAGKHVKATLTLPQGSTEYISVIVCCSKLDSGLHGAVVSLRKNNGYTKETDIAEDIADYEVYVTRSDANFNAIIKFEIIEA